AGAHGSAGTLVDAVVHTVAIAVLGTAARIDFRVLDGVRACIEAIRHAIAIGIERAPLRIHDGTHRCVGTTVLVVGNAVSVGVTEAASACEDRQTGGAHDVPSPIAAGEPGVGGVDRTSLDPQGHALAEEHPVADRAVNGVIGEGVAGNVRELHAGVAAQDI